jgi:hypothetical protein
MSKKPKRDRQTAMDHLDARDRALGDTPLGAAFTYLVRTASDHDTPPDMSKYADGYLYGGGYERWFRVNTLSTTPNKRPRVR